MREARGEDHCEGEGRDEGRGITERERGGVRG